MFRAGFDNLNPKPLALIERRFNVKNKFVIE